MRMDRAAAVGAVVCGVAATAGLAVATGTGRVVGYVSEAGVVGAPHAGLYRIGILAVAAAVALLAITVRTASRPAAVLLAVAVPCVVLSGSVRCSTGCPLPPFETPTAADLAHAGASIAAVLLCQAAMGVLALPAVPRAVRLTSRVGLAFALPLNIATGLAILLAGRGTATGVLERMALFTLLAWLVAVAAASSHPR